MSILLATSAAMVLSCGLTAMPDGEKGPVGTIPMINAPIPEALATSLASGSPPPARIRFADSRDLMSEWIIGVQSDPERGNLLARLSHDVFGFKVRFGWAGQNPGADGISSFAETSVGTCQVKDAAALAQKATQ